MRYRRNWIVPKGKELTDMDRKILFYQEHGHLVPSPKLIKTPEQIEGIRRSGKINTGVLDLVEKEIHAGMSTAEIDKLVYDYTVDHGAIPAPLNYEASLRACARRLTRWFATAFRRRTKSSRKATSSMSTCRRFSTDTIPTLPHVHNRKTTPEKEKLVRVTKECLELGMKAAKPYGFVGDIGHAIERHAKKNGFSVVRDLCGHGRRTGVPRRA